MALTPTPTHTQAHFEDCICQDLHAHTTKAMRSGRLDVFSFHFGPFIRFTFEVTPYDVPMWQGRWGRDCLHCLPSGRVLIAISCNGKLNRQSSNINCRRTFQDPTLGSKTLIAAIALAIDCHPLFR